MKHSPLANSSTPKSATDPAWSMTAPQPQLPPQKKSRTSCSTTTSPLTTSVFAKTSNTSASPSALSFSTPRVQRLCAYSAKRLSTAALPWPTSRGAYPKYCMPTGALCLTARTLRSSNCSTRPRRGATCKVVWLRAARRENSLSYLAYLRPTAPITPYRISLRCSVASGTTSSSSSALPRRASSKTRLQSSIRLRFR